MFARLTSGTVRSPEKQIRLVVNTMYPPAYLDEVVQAEGEWKGKTQRERIEAVSHRSLFSSSMRQEFPSQQLMVDAFSHALIGHRDSCTATISDGDNLLPVESVNSPPPCQSSVLSLHQECEFD